MKVIKGAVQSCSQVFKVNTNNEVHPSWNINRRPSQEKWDGRGFLKAYEKRKMCTKFYSENMIRRNYFQRLEIYVRTILKWTVAECEGVNCILNTQCSVHFLKSVSTNIIAIFVIFADKYMWLKQQRSLSVLQKHNYIIAKWVTERNGSIIQNNYNII
jgi:hypothetical protein